MAYNSKNNFRVYAENATSEKTSTEGAIFDDITWKDSVLRTRGAKEGVASSQEYNTGLKQASIMSTVLAEILASRYNKEITTEKTNFESYITDLSNCFSNGSLLLANEVEKTNLGQSVVNGTFPDMKVGTSTLSEKSDKLKDNKSNTYVKFEIVTKAEYDASTKSSDVIYFIKSGS